MAQVLMRQPPAGMSLKLRLTLEQRETRTCESLAQHVAATGILMVRPNVKRSSMAADVWIENFRSRPQDMIS
jgi:hypothetical protein